MVFSEDQGHRQQPQTGVYMPKEYCLLSDHQTPVYVCDSGFCEHSFPAFLGLKPCCCLRKVLLLDGCCCLADLELYCGSFKAWPELHTIVKSMQNRVMELTLLFFLFFSFQMKDYSKME